MLLSKAVVARPVPGAGSATTTAKASPASIERNGSTGPSARITPSPELRPGLEARVVFAIAGEHQKHGSGSGSWRRPEPLGTGAAPVHARLQVSG